MESTMNGKYLKYPLSLFIAGSETSMIGLWMQGTSSLVYFHTSHIWGKPQSTFFHMFQNRHFSQSAATRIFLYISIIVKNGMLCSIISRYLGYYQTFFPSADVYQCASASLLDESRHVQSSFRYRMLLI